MTSASRPPPRILLFDIDGTLLHAGGAGKRALEQALEHHLGPATHAEASWLGELKLDGMTDRLIVREALNTIDLPFDEALCDRILETYATRLETEIRAAHFEILPGVTALLQALVGTDFTYGLCTGNIAGGARIKLARGGLDRFFGFGPEDVNGFADDGEARVHIVEAALRRASAHLKRRVAPEETLIIGDTPRDILAAHAAGCPALAVATGRYDVEALRAEGADYAVPTLEAGHIAGILFG